MVDILERIACQFLCCVPLKRFEWFKCLDKVSWEQQNVLLQSTVLSALNVRKPVRQDYQRQFLKHIILSLESQCCEIHDSVYETFTELSLNVARSAFTYKHYRLAGEQKTISVTESKALISEGTTGLVTWPAGLALAEWLIKNKLLCAGKDIIELGSGTGVAGLILANVCRARSVYLSDCHPAVLCVLRENLRNSEDLMTTKTDVLELDWLDCQKCDYGDITRIDMVIASDIIYDSSLFSGIIATMTYIHMRFGCAVEFIFATTIRNDKTFDEFLSTCSTHHFVIVDMEYEPPDRLYWDETVPIRLLKLYKTDAIK